MPPRNKIRDNRGRIWYTCRSKLSESAINDRSLKRVISVFNSVSYRAKRLKFMFDLIRKDRVIVRVQVKPVQCWFILWSCFFSNWKIVWSHYNRKWYSRHLKRPRETCCVFSVSCVIEVRKISFFLNLIQFEVTRGPSPDADSQILEDRARTPNLDILICRNTLVSCSARWRQ